ncbi:hypothetical protein QL285_049472 [Trifolium repens]|nr:hypothetical protein QL285_049472 [Trifolium repens]
MVGIVSLDRAIPNAEDAEPDLKMSQRKLCMKGSYEGILTLEAKIRINSPKRAHDECMASKVRKLSISQVHNWPQRANSPQRA